MSIFLLTIIVILIFAATSLLTTYTLRHFRKPYRWKCKVCGFKVAEDTKYAFDISRSSHNHSRLAEFKDTDPWRSKETLEACKRFHPGEPCKPGKNHPAAGRAK